MNYNEALLSTELVIESNGVPIIVGYSGIGKTALAREIAIKNNYHCIIIDGNMLKEGEIGGLPTVEEYKINEFGIEKVKKRTVYAVHSKMQEIEEIILNDNNKKVLLFIDEINRCEHSVQQELMNIILNREINGYKLPENVLVMSAMNPSNKYNSLDESDYQVVDMDPAQENRFIWLEMESDVKSWLSFGMLNKINTKVLEFISTFPELLHTPKSKDTVKATPRSWERVSKTLDVYIEKEDAYNERIFFNVIKGNVGSYIAQEFLSFLNNNKTPIISSNELFQNSELTEDVVNKIKVESHSRLYLIFKNALMFIFGIEDIYDKKLKINILSKVLGLYPVDLRIGLMVEIKENYKEIYKEFLDDDSFIEGYFSAHKVSKIKQDI